MKKIVERTIIRLRFSVSHGVRSEQSDLQGLTSRFLMWWHTGQPHMLP